MTNRKLPCYQIYSYPELQFHSKVSRSLPGLPTQVYFHGPEGVLAGGLPAVILALVLVVFVFLPLFTAGGSNNNGNNNGAATGKAPAQHSSNGNGRRASIPGQPGRRFRDWAEYLRLRYDSSCVVVLVKVLVFALWIIVAVSAGISLLPKG